MIAIFAEKCIGCRLCERACLFGGIAVSGKTPTLTDQCTGCGACVSICPKGALVADKAQPGQIHHLEAYRGIFVIVEQRSGVLQPVSCELITAARRLADIRGVPLSAVLLGNNISRHALTLVAHGADTVYIADAPFLEHYRTLPYVRILTELIASKTPEIVLLGATTIGRDLAPRLANHFRTGLTADCTDLSIDNDGTLLQTRPAFGGNIMATITTPLHRPQMATVRPGVFTAEPIRTGQGEIVHIPVTECSVDNVVEIVRIEPKQKPAVSLEQAQVIVAGGRGIGEGKYFAMLEELAHLLNGEVGASRGAVDLGWIGHEHQVGQTGKTVRPRIYIACGISGAVQHLAGMQSSDIIIAINNDPHAPIFQSAHIGLLGDVHAIVPEIIRQLRQ
ncbi:MAG: FAD-binding protein [Desulfobacterota bacterium]|nr:FAD-binding protein [Thermodesulfobacteriota bacterium]